jgi:hypothetical protein
MRTGVSMNQLQKAGGLAALIEAGCYLIGFAMLATAFNPGNTDAWSETQKLEFILGRKALFQIWTIIIYVVFGIALVVLAAALHQLLNGAAPELMSVATPFGLIWAGLVIASGMVSNVGLDMVAETYLLDVDQAVQAWSLISTVRDGLGGGVEIVGGVWVFLISLAALRGASALPRTLVYLGFVVGSAGVLTIIPALGWLGVVFGLSQIVWFVFVGVILLRRESP